jgi:hypothetical protein
MNITSIKEDNDLVNQGHRPNYIVVSEQIAAPFISADIAIKWHYSLLQSGIKTTIWDLTDYDWDVNPAKFKIHDISTDEGVEDVAKDLAMRNQTVIN